VLSEICNLGTTCRAIKSEVFSAIRERNCSERLLELGYRCSRWIVPPIDRSGGDGGAERTDGGGVVQCDRVDGEAGGM
jgi:hypothetical protein